MFHLALWRFVCKRGCAFAREYSWHIGACSGVLTYSFKLAFVWRTGFSAVREVLARRCLHNISLSWTCSIFTKMKQEGENDFLTRLSLPLCTVQKTYAPPGKVQNFKKIFRGVWIAWTFSSSWFLLLVSILHVARCFWNCSLLCISPLSSFGECCGSSCVFCRSVGRSSCDENRAVYVKSIDSMIYFASCFVKLCLSPLSAICVRRRCESRNITFVLAVHAESEVSL